MNKGNYYNLRTKKDFLIKFYELWLERLVSAEIDIEVYRKLDKDEVIISEEVPNNSALQIGKNGMMVPLLTKKDILAGDIVKEAEKKKEIAERFCKIILKLLSEEDKSVGI